MPPEDLGPDLTAFALGDPGLTPAQVAAVEARLAADPAAAQAVEETRTLAATLTAALATKDEPAGESALARTVANATKPKARRAVPIWAAALAACVLLALGIGVGRWSEVFDREGTHPESMAAVAVNSEKRSGSRSGGSDPANLLREEHGLDANLDTVVPLSRDAEPTLDQLVPTAPTGTSTFTGGSQPASGEPKPPPSKEQGHGSFSKRIDGSPAGPLTAWPTYAPSAKMPGKTAGEGEKEEKGTPPERTKLVPDRAYEATGHDAYAQLVENPFTEVKGQAALSTFGVDVDTASYSIVRNHLNNNMLPPASAVRLEEMVNYFPYRDAPPEGNDPFAVRVEMAECPWQPKHRLARIALKARPIDTAKRPPCNLVFLIDVSGSMDAPNRLPLVKAAMKLLVGQLGENDRVAIVTYAGESKLNLESTNASQKVTIYRALDELRAGGSTNGGDGIQRAYATARKHFIEKGVNRVVLCTDGDWNVGTTSTEALLELIEGKRKTGVFLSVFGFGMGNLRDEMMVKLAGKGNGNYAYIDGIAEAKKALVEQLSGTLVTVAKDVKIQIEFNPARVAHYRLLGYEKRALAAQDFHDDKKDSGEMGAGHVVTALYELVPAAAEPKADGLRYQPRAEAPKPAADDKTATEVFVLKLRHKMPDKDESVLREIPVGDVAKSFDKPTDDFQFSMSVAAFALLLKNSPYKGAASFALVEELAAASLTHDPGAYRAEFLQLVKKARALSGK